MATVSPLPRTNRITLSSSTAGPFEVGFRLFDTDALDVYVDGLPRTDWTLAATFQNGFSDSATITFTAPLANGAVIQIDGALIPSREDDYINGPGLIPLMNIELARVWASLSEVNRLARTAVRGFDDQDPVDGISAAAFAGLEAALDEAEAAASAASASAAAALLSQQSAAANAALLGVWRGAWVTATVYALGDRVSNAGSSYYALVAHTSAALFSTDLSGGKWGVVAEKGAAGAGTGDVLAANNGSDFANKPTTLANLGGQPVNANLTAESGLTGAADHLSYYTGVGAKALTVLSAFARTFLDDADGPTVLATLGVTALLDARAPATQKHTIWLPAGSFMPTTTAGAAYASQEMPTNDVMVSGFDFSATTDQKIQTTIAMPKSWDEGTITAQVFWKDATTAGTGDVVWGVRALAVSNDDALDAAFGTAQTATDTFIAAGDLHIAPVTAAITPSGTAAEGDLLVVEVYRDGDAGGDTYTQNARFMGVKLIYTTNAGDDA